MPWSVLRRVASTGPVLAMLVALVLLDPPAVGVTGTATGTDVRPWIGTEHGNAWFAGNTSPAAATPFGMVQMGPDTTADPASGAPSAAASGYAWGDTAIRGFSSVRLSGSGCPVLGESPLLPVAGRRPADPGRATVGFSHRAERAAPGRYGVVLADRTRVRLGAARHSGLAQLTFPRSTRRSFVLVKSSASLATSTTASTRIVDDRTIEVSTRSSGFCGFVSNYRVHQVFRFNRRWRKAIRWSPASGDTGTGVALKFRTSSRRTVKVQVGVSFTSIRGARQNLASDAPGWGISRVQDRAAAAWRTELGRVTTTGGTATERAVFDTALYRSLLHPLLYSDASGRYRGFDGAIHTSPAGHHVYTALGTWDMYRSHMPLLAWLRPDVASDVVRSLLLAGREGGWIPRWPLLGQYTAIMNGDSAAPTIAAAHAFGARDFPLAEAVDRLASQAVPTSRAPGQGWFRARPGIEDYVGRGFVTTATRERLIPDRVPGSTTLEYAVDDFALSRLAASAQRPDLATTMARRSGHWRHLLDPERAMLLPRGPDGEFPDASYDAGSCCNGFQEGTATQYVWMVPQDMAGLLGALGPRDVVRDRLEQFFSSLNSGAHRWAWLGNQPGFTTPWAHHYLGRPDLTQAVVDRARSTLWSTGVGGIPGNEDQGSLSSWYVWSAMGLQPLTPGTAVLGVTRPAFDTVTVRPLGRAPTTIRRVGGAAWVGALHVDGVATTRSWIDVGGRWPGEVRVGTTDAAQPTWGTGDQDVPPSWPAP